MLEQKIGIGIIRGVASTIFELILSLRNTGVSSAAGYNFPGVFLVQFPDGRDVLPEPAGPSSRRGFWSFAARNRQDQESAETPFIRPGPRFSLQSFAAHKPTLALILASKD